jgi:hypothetical protein
MFDAFVMSHHMSHHPSTLPHPLSPLPNPSPTRRRASIACAVVHADTVVHAGAAPSDARRLVESHRCRRRLIDLVDQRRRLELESRIVVGVFEQRRQCDCDDHDNDWQQQ